MDLNLGFDARDLAALLPAIALVLTGIALLLVDTLPWNDDEDAQKTSKPHLLFTGIVGCAIAAAALFVDGGLLGTSGSQLRVGGALRVDAFAGFSAMVILVALAFATFSAGGYLGSQGQNRAEFHGLMYLGAAAMILLGQAATWVSLFVAVETLSLSVYVLAGFFRKWKSSSEGALKYFIMGAFSSGFLLFGMAFVFLGTGSIDIDALTGANADPYLVNVGLLLIVVGFGFKVGAVPFHSWVPDAYQGAPAISAGWMAVAVKTCSFVALLRVVLSAEVASAELSKILAALAVVTMVLGNLAALVQTNLKRMLAYSGIAHSGYLLIPVVLCFQNTHVDAGASALFYLGAYALMTTAGFTAIAVISSGDEDREDLNAIRGLGRRQPLVALALTVSLLSLAGIPGTVGFLGKLSIFQEAVSSSSFLYLAVIGILASLVSVYYYLRPIVAMYFREGDEIPLVADAWGAKLVLSVTTIATVGLFAFGKPLHEFSVASIRAIAG